MHSSMCPGGLVKGLKCSSAGILQHTVLGLSPAEVKVVKVQVSLQYGNDC